MADNSKPYSAACERNRDPILEVLQREFGHCRNVLEIGSGTGQHAVHFAKALSHLRWQTSDRAENLSGIATWLTEASLANTPAPFEFNVDDRWPSEIYDAVFSANTLHIMSWPQVERLFAHLPRLLAREAVVAIYGPFNYNGQFTSESNAAFDQSLKARGPQMGLRDFAAVNELVKAAGLRFCDDFAMPANNRLLVWRQN